MRVLLGVVTFFWLSLMALCAPNNAALYQTAQAGTVPAPSTPPATWTVDPERVNIGIFVVDYPQRTLQQAYFFQETPCVEPLADELIITNARAAFSNTLTGERIALTIEAGGMIAESLHWEAQFLAWAVHLGDFTGKALVAPCSGNVLFAGESIWSGQGVRPYPNRPLPPASLIQLSTSITPPQSLALIEQSAGMTMSATTAWSAIADLNLLHALAQQPVTTHAFLYRPATGYVEPAAELAQAQWIFIVATASLLSPPNRTELYLPLIRQ